MRNLKKKYKTIVKKKGVHCIQIYIDFVKFFICSTSIDFVDFYRLLETL